MLNPTPYTLHPTPYTLHPKSSAGPHRGTAFGAEICPPTGLFWEVRETDRRGGGQGCDKDREKGEDAEVTHLVACLGSLTRGVFYWCLASWDVGTFSRFIRYYVSR
jgi:hypothetical protein